MDIAFETRQLRSICEDEIVAIQEIGEETAKMLKHRLADIFVADSYTDILVGNPRIIDDNYLSQFLAIDLNADFTLILCANHKKNPITKQGNIDWRMVNRVKILRIERNT